MTTIDAGADAKVAVLVDCDNTSSGILEHTLRVMAHQCGRVVLRHGYGNQATLANKWQEAQARLASTPCLLYPYAVGRNTSDIALELDAMKAVFDQHAGTFCLVTSNSDLANLCRKLRGRSATSHIVGEAKSGDAPRNASDQLFERAPAESTQQVDVAALTLKPKPAAKPQVSFQHRQFACGRHT